MKRYSVLMYGQSSPRHVLFRFFKILPDGTKTIRYQDVFVDTYQVVVSITSEDDENIILPLDAVKIL